MAWLRLIVAAAIIVLPMAAHAAELTLPRMHRTHRATAHRVQVHAARAHFGYYWGQWGWRRGGTASSWYGSTFVLAGGPWDGPGVVLKASPKGIASIHCREGWPHACLAEPLVAPVAVAEPSVWR
jgi:hypothetical protein